jgi:peptidoglycan-N-acetylglucosamine deacetylase
MQSVRASANFIFAAVVGASVGAAGALLDAVPARAQECPGNPDALGTSRVLVLEPNELTRIGEMQYPQSLPLADKEVVLTFDDGPLPPYSNQILDILASQCVKATYFLVGEMAHNFPATVRRIYEAGHTIGTHSEDHPPRFQKLPLDKLRWEIDQGIADVGAALGDPKELAPFFRIPGLARTDTIEQELAARSLVAFSSDTVADDWHRHIKPRDIISRAMSRLEKRGKGILLLHDIHKSTVAALPELLKELKEKGFRVVHVIPGEAPGRIETVGEPNSLTTGSTTSWSDDRTDPNWPTIIAREAADHTVLPVPDAASFDTGYLPRQRIMLADRSASAGYLALAAGTEWSDPSRTALPSNQAELPALDIRDVGPALLELRAGAEMLGVSPNISLPAAGKTSAAESPTPQE